MPNLLFIDFETTGLDPIRHSIHRMAGQVVVDGKLACVFDYKMKPDPLKNIDKQSLDIANVALSDIKNYPNPVEGFIQFSREVVWPFVRTDVPSSKLFIIAYNAGALEMPFMREWYRSMHVSRKEFASHFHSGFIDVMSMATQYFMQMERHIASYSLSNIASVLGIKVDASLLHNPVYDVELTRQVYEHIISNK